MSKQHRKATTRQPVTPGMVQSVGDDERHAMIAAAAYLLAEQRGFQGDAVLDDWLRAEAEVNAGLSTSE